MTQIGFLQLTLLPETVLMGKLVNTVSIWTYTESDLYETDMHKLKHRIESQGGRRNVRICEIISERKKDSLSQSLFLIIRKGLSEELMLQLKHRRQHRLFSVTMMIEKLRKR